MFPLLTKISLINKKTILISGLILLGGLLILGVVWFVKSQSQSARRVEAIKQIAAELDSSLAVCSQEKNPSSCKEKKVEVIAVRIDAVELCNKLDGRWIDSCVWEVARQNNNVGACENLSTQEKQDQCEDSVYRSLADNDLDLSWCKKINNEGIKTGCYKTVSEQIAKQKGCNGTGVEQSLCDRFLALNSAVASKDPNQCMLLSEITDQADCLDLVGVGDKDLDNLDAALESRLGTSDESLDSDFDGLSDYDEYFKYRTDPAKIDTDGDGYNDGVEINGGYNPLGSGKL